MSIIRGICWKKASATAGAKLSDADPEVQQSIVGFLICCVIPIAIKAADRSSLMDLHCIFGLRAKAMVRGAFREPGDMIARFKPCLAQISIRLKIG